MTIPELAGGKVDRYRVGPHLFESERHAIRDAADEFRPLWSLGKTDQGRIKGHEISVDIDGPPIRRAPYRLSKTKNDFLIKWFKAMMDIGVIRRSSSSWAAATLLPPKKDDNGNVTNLHVVHDYRPHNASTEQRAYPILAPN